MELLIWLIATVLSVILGFLIWLEKTAKSILKEYKKESNKWKKEHSEKLEDVVKEIKEFKNERKK